MISINSVTVHFFHLDNVLRTVLALFMEDEALPLPSLEEVLICNPNTTAEEVRVSPHTCAQHNKQFTYTGAVHYMCAQDGELCTCT